jgi:hypothetical protein
MVERCQKLVATAAITPSIRARTDTPANVSADADL